MEALYHYLWLHRMFGSQFLSGEGKKIEILSPGRHNVDAGPDFSTARIRIDGEEWIGNVEIHVKASDWMRHGHHSDPAYDSVILHVVGVDDCVVSRRDGSDIPQICVSPSPDFYGRYAALIDEMDAPGCLPYVDSVPDINRKDWLNAVGFERLQEKGEYMKDILEASAGDWQQTLFIVVARALGFGLNGVPFELLAKSLPLNFVMRHRDNPEQVEALVFGQAGMLGEGEYPYDDYYTLLCREYKFLRAKYSLAPIEGSLWKYSRTRPQNFPHRRMAILAAMLCEGMQMHTRLLEASGNYEKVAEIFRTGASDYWKRHQRFGTAPSELPLPTSLSEGSVDILCINVAAPFYVAYGAITGDPGLAEKGLDLLNEIRPERNSLVNIWNSTSLKASNAFDSQALLQLRKSYCQRSRCLNCRLGHYLLRQVM